MRVSIDMLRLIPGLKWERKTMQSSLVFLIYRIRMVLRHILLYRMEIGRSITSCKRENVLEAGTLKRGEWQNVSMDIDMKTDTFRVSVDGEYLLAGVNAIQATDSLQTIFNIMRTSWNREVADVIGNLGNDGEHRKQRKGVLLFINPEENPDESVIQQPE